MTRKQYQRKMMRLQRNLNEWAKNRGLKPSKFTDKTSKPNFGTTIILGSHKGEILKSYKQAWEIMVEVFGENNEIFKGIL